MRFFGFVPDATLAALYRLASVFAFPSLYEGFGLPPLEAMACGTPVVTSRLSSLPEVVGDAALLADPYAEADIPDGLERVLVEPGLGERLAQAGRARVAAFSWERSVRAIHDVYLQVLGAPLPSRAGKPRRRDHPPALLCAIEVADSSLSKDRGLKARLYAEAGVPEYWIVNLRDRVIEVRTRPTGGVYAEVAIYRSGDLVRLNAFPDVTVAVDSVIG